MNRYLEAYPRRFPKYPDLHGGDVKKHWEQAKKNPALRVIFVILVIALVLYLLYRLWLYLVKRQSRDHNKCIGHEGCLFFDGVKNTSKKIDMIKNYKKSIIPSTEYAVSSWIYMQSSNFDMQNQHYRETGFISTVYAYAEVDAVQKNSGGPSDLMYQVQPGVWLNHTTNELIIRWSTSSRNPLPIQCCDMTCSKNTEGKRCTQDGEHYICKATHDSNSPYTGILHKETQADLSQNIHLNKNHEDKHTIKIKNIPIERWFHLVITVRGASIDIYVDGKLVHTRILTSAPNVLRNPTMIVSGTGHNHDFGFKGYMTEHRYFNVGLSSYDVLSIYSKGPDPFHLLSPKQFVKKYL